MSGILQRVQAATPFTDTTVTDYAAMRNVLDNGADFAMFTRPLLADTYRITYDSADLLVGFYSPSGATFTLQIQDGDAADSAQMQLAPGEFKLAFKGACIYPCVIGRVCSISVLNLNTTELYAVHAHISNASRAALVQEGRTGVQLVDGWSLVMGRLRR